MTEVRPRRLGLALLAGALLVLLAPACAEREPAAPGHAGEGHVGDHLALVAAERAGALLVAQGAARSVDARFLALLVLGAGLVVALLGGAARDGCEERDRPDYEDY